MCKNLPPEIKHDKWILSLNKRQSSGVYYEDNLCFFRALSVLKNANVWVKRFVAADLSVNYRPECFLSNGLDTPTNTTPSHPFLVLLWISSWIYKKCFQVNIQIFSIREDGVGTRVWSGASKPDWPNLNLLLHEHHFCYIKNVDFLSIILDVISVVYNIPKQQSQASHMHR